jgi:hypothetical protein
MKAFREAKDIMLSSSFADRLAGAMREVRGTTILEVEHEAHGRSDNMSRDAERIFGAIAAAGFPLDAKLRRCYFSSRNIALQWRARSREISLSGEFDVMNVVVTLDKLLPLEDLVRTDSDRQLLSELHLVDDISRGGEGKMAALRLHEGVTDPEVWFLDHYHDYVKLDIDYCQYLEQLLITKGVAGWQYLFADVDLNRREYEGTVLSLQEMLAMFPELFPGYDYAPLRARLEERL